MREACEHHVDKTCMSAVPQVHGYTEPGAGGGDELTLWPKCLNSAVVGALCSRADVAWLTPLPLWLGSEHDAFGLRALLLGPGYIYRIYI